MPRARRGFTLIEVVIAVILIDVALLALVGSTAVLVRQANTLRMHNAAIAIGSKRLQLLGTSPCVAASGEASDARGIQEFWFAVVMPNNVRALSDSVSFSIGAVAKSVVLRTALPC
jgi:Tfp pilus assembly protein PilV